jgi:hypothetical protein
MNYQQKLDAALVLIKEYNEAVGAKSPQWVNGEIFIANLKALGAVNEADLDSLKWEQVLKCLEHAQNEKGSAMPPQKLAEKIAAVGVFREEKDAVVTEATPVRVSAKKADKMTLKELCAALDPEEPNNPVARRLNEIAKGRPFIIYESGRIVHVDGTFSQISALKAGHPAVDAAVVNGLPVKVWQLGDLPDNFADENPLYPNRPLRPDGTCDQTLRSYSGISKDVRQFLRVALNVGDKRGGFSVNSIKDANDHMDEALSGLAALRGKYPRVSIEFDDLAKKNKLPDLQIELVAPKDIPQQAEKKSPFAEGNKVQWTRTATNSYEPISDVLNRAGWFDLGAQHGQKRWH